ncbi:hypothetical protein [Mycolicibacterium elephantis]|uniref:hypothetical protein n=1 Tax=Mycolicibacterium elephantis TaxID=81858 RepID=UPI000FE18CD7|nr:hypothetical protein [Mycolicibacterium elephantis]MCV7221612.1 hypothetical protein [Mycolicibacterium elephantis]
MSRLGTTNPPANIPKVERNHIEVNDTTAALLQAIAAEPCPDCTAHVEMRRVSDRVLVANVMHDGTCPWYRQRVLAGVPRRERRRMRRHGRAAE